MAYPDSLETYTTKEDGVTIVATFDFNNLQRACEAIQKKVGVDNSASPRSMDYKLYSTLSPGHTHSNPPITAQLSNNEDWSGYSISDIIIGTNTVGTFGGLYIKSNGKYSNSWYKDSNTLPCIGIAVTTGTGSGKEILTNGYIRNESWNWVIGSPVFVGATGEFTQTPFVDGGKEIQCVGVALHQYILNFNPDLTVVTATTI